MKTRPIPAALCAFALYAAALSAQAAGWVAVLKDTPAEAFDDEDISLFLGAARSVLNAPDVTPQPVTWSNPSSGAGGRFEQVGQSTDKSGAPCKRLRFSVYAKHHAEKTVTWTACKAPDGRWKLVAAK